MSVETNFIRKLVEKAIERFHESRQLFRGVSIGVTDLLWCLRRAYYFRAIPEDDLKLLIEENGSELADYYTFVGKSVHESLQEGIELAINDIREMLHDKDARVVIEYPLLIPIGNGFVEGHPDVLIVGKNYAILLEIKTVARIPTYVYEQHEIQASVYAKALERLVKNVRAFVVYISRSKGEIRVYEVQPDEKHIEFLKERYEKLVSALETNTPPEEVNTLFCFKCAFRSICDVYSGQKTLDDLES